MAFEHNDIATKSGLRAGLGETSMGFEHNDIVTTDVMNAAIAAGGGGGGDFSTCEVTITNIGNDSVSFYAFAYIDEEEDFLNYNPVNMPAGRSHSFETVLYKNATYIGPDSGSIQSVTGNATLDNGEALVSGNCTITVTNA